MMYWRSALSGKMPFYKIIGNKILTSIQNYFCKTSLSEFHTGYRAYTTSFLKSIPFELNSNQFHFDTEILLQAFHARAKIVEFPIPTRYADEVCRVPGLGYAGQILLASLYYRLQKMGLCTSIKFPYSSNSVYASKTDDPNSTHSYTLHTLKQIGLQDKKVLDIGCGPGHLTQEIKTCGGKVSGVDLFEPMTVHSFDKFICKNLDLDKWDTDISEFNFVLLLDIIEHLSKPEQFLIELRKKARSAQMPLVIISTANIGFLSMRFNLLLGQFNYADRGILDITHKRLFTLGSFKRLLKETGYSIRSIRGVGVPFLTLGKNPFFKCFGFISAILARSWPSLFAFQFIAKVEPLPTAYHILQSSEQVENKILLERVS